MDMKDFAWINFMHTPGIPVEPFNLYAVLVIQNFQQIAAACPINSLLWLNLTPLSHIAILNLIMTPKSNLSSQLQQNTHKITYAPYLPHLILLKIYYLSYILRILCQRLIYMKIESILNLWDLNIFLGFPTYLVAVITAIPGNFLTHQSH